MPVYNKHFNFIPVVTLLRPEFNYKKLLEKLGNFLFKNSIRYPAFDFFIF